MRYPSIDILRMFAIFVMVLVHFGENLSGFQSPIAGFGAPLFAFLAGVSYCLWSKGLAARGKSQAEISQISVRRALFVFGLGFAFNIFVWLPEDVFNWDVLTFIGASLVLLSVVRHLPSEVLTLIAFVSLLVSPILRTTVDYSAYWQDGYFDPDMSLPDVIIGFLVTGYFPIFPWIIFPLTGYQVGMFLFADRDDSTDPAPSPWLIVYMGTSLFALAILLLSLRPYLPDTLSQNMLSGWTMFPATTEYVACVLGISLTLLGLMHRYVDLNPAAIEYRGWLNIPKVFSRYSLTIYVLHHVVHLWPMWIYAVAVGQEPTYFWMQAMSLQLSIPLALLFLMCTYGVLYYLGDERSYGLEACMRWLCD